MKKPPNVSIELPQNVELIIAALERDGYKAYAVGGCVRDAARGVAPKDWDICTSALPEQTKLCFKDCPVVETGLKHGTVTLVLQGEPYEITTFRIDGTYSDERHPDEVMFVGELREDLARRDFTINAMAYNPREGLVDPFVGRADLEQKVIRAVGGASDRFKEDALRIMRALRFASTLGFTLEHETAAALLENSKLLQNISAERIAAELNGILLGGDVERVLLDYGEVLEVPIPELGALMGFSQHNPYHTLDVWQHTVRSVAATPRDKHLRLALLLHDIAKPHCCTEADGIGHFLGHPQESARIAEQILKRLKYSRATIQTVTELVAYHDAEITPQKSHVKRWLSRIGEERLRQLIEVKRADIKAQAPQYQQERLDALNAISEVLNEVVQQHECFSLKDLAVDGNDLLLAGVSDGREVGRILDDLLSKVIDGDIKNDKPALLEYVNQRERQEPGAGE